MSSDGAAPRNKTQVDLLNAQAELEAKREELLQQRQEFDLIQEQRKITFQRTCDQDNHWHKIRIGLSLIALSSLPLIAIINGWILFHSENFSRYTTNVATTALLVTSTGLLVGILRVVLGPSPRRVDPIGPSASPPNVASERAPSTPSKVVK